MWLFSVELLVTFVALYFLREGLIKVFSRSKIAGDSFFKRSLSIVLKILLSLGWDRFDAKDLNSRERLFAVAVSSFSWIVFGLLTAMLVASLSYLGVYHVQSAFLNKVALVLANSSFSSLMICFCIGFAPTILVGKPYIAFVLVSLLIPAFYLSMPGAIFMIAGEVIALQMRTKPRPEMWVRAACTFVTLALFFLAGPLLRPLFQSSLDMPYFRLVGVLMYLGIFVTVDLAMSMIVFHFWHKRAILA